MLLTPEHFVRFFLNKSPKKKQFILTNNNSVNNISNRAKMSTHFDRSKIHIKWWTKNCPSVNCYIKIYLSVKHLFGRFFFANSFPQLFFLGIFFKLYLAPWNFPYIRIFVLNVQMVFRTYRLKDKTNIFI